MTQPPAPAGPPHPPTAPTSQAGGSNTASETSQPALLPAVPAAAPLPAKEHFPVLPGSPPVIAAVPVPGLRAGAQVPGVQLSRRPRHPRDTFGWPANAAPGKPEGEVDTRP